MSDEVVGNVAWPSGPTAADPRHPSHPRAVVAPFWLAP
jgi:hypothetical protein